MATTVTQITITSYNPEVKIDINALPSVASVTTTGYNTSIGQNASDNPWLINLFATALTPTVFTDQILSADISTLSVEVLDVVVQFDLSYTADLSTTSISIPESSFSSSVTIKIYSDVISNIDAPSPLISGDSLHIADVTEISITSLQETVIGNSIHASDTSVLTIDALDVYVDVVTVWVQFPAETFELTLNAKTVTVNNDWVVFPNTINLSLSSPVAYAFSPAICLPETFELNIDAAEVLLPTVAVASSSLNADVKSVEILRDKRFEVNVTTLSIDIPEVTVYYNIQIDADVINLDIKSSEVIELPLVSVATTRLDIDVKVPAINEEYTILVGSAINLNVISLDVTVLINGLIQSDISELNIELPDTTIIGNVIFDDLTTEILTNTHSVDVNVDYAIGSDLSNLQILSDSVYVSIGTSVFIMAEVINLSVHSEPAGVILGLSSRAILGLSVITTNALNPTILLGDSQLIELLPATVETTILEPVISLNPVTIDSGVGLTIEVLDALVRKHVVFENPVTELIITPLDVTWFAAVHADINIIELNVEILDVFVETNSILTIDAIVITIDVLDPVISSSITIFDDVDETNLINVMELSSDDVTINTIYREIVLKASVKQLKPKLLEIRAA